MGISSNVNSKFQMNANEGINPSLPLDAIMVSCGSRQQGTGGSLICIYFYLEKPRKVQNYRWSSSKIITARCEMDDVAACYCI